MDPHRSFSVLDLSMDATAEQVRQVYRDLVSVWHPDRYAHNPRLQKKAEEKVKEINAAYAEVTAFIAARPVSGSRIQVDGRSGKTAASPGKDLKKTAGAEASGTQDRNADWKRTEAVLASLKQARARAEARERAQAQAAAEARAREAALQAERKQQRADAARKAREAQLEADQRRAREAEVAKQRQWQQTEARLQAMLKREAGPAGSQPPVPATRLSSFRAALIQWIVYAGALTGCFSVNIIQNRYRFGIFAIVGLCVGAVLICRILITRTRLKTLIT